MKLGKIYSWILSKLTILRWFPDYERSTLKGDLVAGLTVGVMLIPQGMAYAVLAGIPAVYGLYASLVPLLIYPLFGTSKQLSVGIVAIDMLIVSAGISLIAEPGSTRFIQLVMLLTIVVGITQVAMSIARLGFIVNLLSKPVILGFTAAAPIIISFTQLQNLSGVELPQSQHIYVVATAFFSHTEAVHPLTLGIGLTGIVMLFLLKNFSPRTPRSLILILLSAVIVWSADLQREGVEIVGSIPKGLPAITLPEFSFDDLRRMVPTVLTLALVQFMNVVTLGRTFASKYRYTISPNRELFAVGCSNMFGGFFRSPPVSGSFSRSAVNDQSGARTPLTNLFAAVLVGLTLLFLTPLFYYVPMPALAAIIIVASLGLIDIRELVYVFKTKERDGYIALFTFLTTLIIGIQEGILLGVGASLIAVLLRTSRPNVAELGHIEGSRFFRDIRRFPEAKRVEGILVLRVDASFSFNNAEYFKDYIIQKSEEEDRTIRAVVIDGISINDLDTTAVEALQIVVDNLQELDIELHFAGLKGPIRDIMLRSGLARKLGGTHFHMTPHRAVKYILNRWAEEGRMNEEYRHYLETVD